MRLLGTEGGLQSSEWSQKGSNCVVIIFFKTKQTETIQNKRKKYETKQNLLGVLRWK